MKPSPRSVQPNTQVATRTSPDEALAPPKNDQNGCKLDRGRKPGDRLIAVPAASEQKKPTCDGNKIERRWMMPAGIALRARPEPVVDLEVV
jgi:hypothetical protein